MRSAVHSRGWWAALIFPMAFTYQFGANPPIDYVRLLISDTQDSGHVFEDAEITTFANIVSSVWQSSMQYSASGGLTTLPSSPVNYLRAAALALDSIAANKSRLSSIVQLLDVKLSVDKAAEALRAQATQYREVDDESMAFVVIEQCNTDWSFRQRFWNQWQRVASA